MTNTYKYNLKYQHTDPNGGKKTKERVCEVSVPSDKWTTNLYSNLEKWLINKEGGGDITIIEVEEA